jgi:uncharacterized protein (TIGR03086 family)
MSHHSTLYPAIKECADAVAAMAAGIGTEQLGDRTPCEKFTVAELLDHLGGTLTSSVRAARKEPLVPVEDVSAPMSPALVAESAVLAAAAWAGPAAYEGVCEFGPGEMPAGFAAAITLQELALHGWDLARATGRPFTLGEDTAQVTLGVVEQIAEQARSTGGYAPPVPVSAGTRTFQRALAASGRNPEWHN